MCTRAPHETLHGDADAPPAAATAAAGGIETADHLFASCCYTQEIWFAVSRILNIHIQSLGTIIADWWMQLTVGMSKHRKKGFDSSFMLISWTIWKERNDRVFGRSPAQSAAQLITSILHQAQLWIEAGAKHMITLGWPAATVGTRSQ
uniref:Reverse transcriptase zinc-binding domain-containing protein n=1 Tax=Setaria italica TaxID=4555 RepID=K3Y1G1_SETIT